MKTYRKDEPFGQHARSVLFQLHAFELAHNRTRKDELVNAVKKGRLEESIPAESTFLHVLLCEGLTDTIIALMSSTGKY